MQEKVEIITNIFGIFGIIGQKYSKTDTVPPFTYAPVKHKYRMHMYAYLPYCPMKFPS